jgi:hypothetical protein
MSKSSLLVFAAVIASCFIGCSSDQSVDPLPAGSGGESGAGSGGESGGGGASGEGGASGMMSGGTGGDSGEGGVSGAAGASGGMGGDGGGGGGGGGCDGGGMVDDVVERIRYEAPEVEAGEACESETQTRTCTVDGWTDWSGTFTATTCMTLAETCDGMMETRTRYEASEVPYGEECASQAQTRSCADETWGEWIGNFEHELCTVAAAADCEGAEHGEDASRVHYLTASVPYGQTCMSELQTAPCDNGELGAWSGMYTFASCEPEPGLPCGDLASGAQHTRMRYATATVPYAQTCTAETQTQTCTNGVLGDWTGAYTIEACTVDPPGDCAGGVHGDTHMRTRYQAATVTWGTSCVSEQQVEMCSNGTWLPWTGTYTQDGCTVSDPIDCDGGAHGTSQMRTRYSAANVPNGQTCQSEIQTRLCTNGTWSGWSGSYTQVDCVVLPPYAGSCTLKYLGEPYACIDAVGSIYVPANIMAVCVGADRTYSAGHCVRNGDLYGVCASPGGGQGAEQDLYYYESAVYPTDAGPQTECNTVMGAWDPE